jgi:hypothetical protein
VNISNYHARKNTIELVYNSDVREQKNNSWGMTDIKVGMNVKKYPQINKII